MAYQASKWPDTDHHLFFAISPSMAKKLGNRLGKREDWDDVKYDIMLQLVVQKFITDANLKQKLIDTGTKHLEERNYWGDVYWGTNPKGVGKNKLGEILMKVRELCQ